MSNRNKNSDFDNYISILYEEIKLFLKNNNTLIVTQADKSNTTVMIEKSECNKKMEKIFND